MSIKLIALDIDDTLLNSNGQLEAATIQAIERAKKNGIKVVLTTGRPLLSTTKFLERLGLANQADRYVINYHGTLIQTTTGKLIASHPLRFSDIKKVATYIKDATGVDFVAETNEDMFLTKTDMNWHTGFECFKNHYRIHFRSLAQLQAEQNHLTFYKMMFIAPPKILDEVQKNLPSWLLQDYKCARTETSFFDIINKKVNKGWAVKTLAEKLGLTQDEVMAVGDGDSDLPMIQYAGLGVAMKNGTPSLLKAANTITSDQNHAGVAKAIEKYVLK